MQNVLTDDVAPLDIRLFLGNAWSRVFEFPVWFVMPTLVETFAYYAKGGESLPDDQKPTVSISGQLLSLTYPAQLSLISSGYHEILFDGRKQWAGPLTVSRNTSLSAKPESGVVFIQNAVNTPVAISFYGTAPLKIGDVRFLNDKQEFWDGYSWVEVAVTATEGFVPYQIDSNQLFIIPDKRQGLSALRVRVDGRLRVSGRLIFL